MECTICNTDHIRLRSLGNEVWSCYNCLSKRSFESTDSGIRIVKKIRLGSQVATEAQLKELERRRILPQKKEGGGYYLGRMGENGKIQERWPDYA